MHAKRKAALAKYEDLVFSPLALPAPPEVSARRLIAWMTWAREEGHKRGLNRSERGYEARTGRAYPWLMANVYYGERTRVEDSFDEEFPEVALLAQRGSAEVHLHTDSDGYWGFRFYLANERPGGLYFHLARERVAQLPRVADDWDPLVDLGHKRYAPWPDDNRAYCLNSVRAAHAVDRSSCVLGERIACLVFPAGRLDEARLLALLDASTERYGASQIWYEATRAQAQHRPSRGR
jgi:hypothetical protein